MQLVMHALRNDQSSYEVQTDCNSCINAFCEFVFDKLKRKPGFKTVNLHQSIQNYYSENCKMF